MSTLMSDVEDAIFLSDIPNKIYAISSHLYKKVMLQKFHKLSLSPFLDKQP